ncbi:MAG: MFS transporter [Kiloniellaceae bacterium]
MLQTLGSIVSLLLGAGIMMLGNSLLGITLPLKMDAAGFSTEMTGLVMAAYFGGLLVGSVYGKRLITEVGHIRAFAGFAAIMAAVVLAHPMLVNALSWGLLRFLSGFCIAGLFAILESWLNERSDNATRGQVLSVYMMVYYSAIMSGQLMVNLWDLERVEGFMVAALLICLSLVPVVLTRVEAPDLSDLKALRFRDLYRASPLAVVGCSAAGLMMGSYYGVGPLFARNIGLGLFDVSLFMGAVILGAFLLQWPIGRLSDRFDRRTVLLWMLVLAVLACLAAIAATGIGDPLPVLLVLAPLLGGAMTSLYPLSLGQAYDYLPRDRYVAAASGLVLAYGIGATAGPALSALAMGALGPPAFFGFIGLVAVVFAGFVLYRMRVRAPLPAEQQESFVAMPRMSPVVCELDPRAAEPAEVETGEPAEVEPAGPAEEIAR